MGNNLRRPKTWFGKALEIQSRKLPDWHDEILRNKNSLAICFQYPRKLH